MLYYAPVKFLDHQKIIKKSYCILKFNCYICMSLKQKQHMKPELLTDGYKIGYRDQYPKENIFNKFNKDFFKNGKAKITWYDAEGVVEIATDRVAHIELVTNGTRDKYEGYCITINSKTNGLITRKTFLFKHHLEFRHMTGQTEYSHVWANGGKLDWYISRPGSTNIMVETIMDYVNKYSV